MPLDPVLRDQLNRQVTNERFNSAFYKAAEVRLEILNLTGMAHFMRDASQDETSHAQRLIDYLIDRNETPLINSVDMPTLPATPDLITAGAILFGAALQREQQVTQQINYLYLLSLEVKDPQSAVFLEWFIQEQTRSERELVELVGWLTFAEGCAAAVLQLDHELGEGEK
jgi:ferritin